VIATRGSQLALWQAEHVKARLTRRVPGLDVTFNVIKTQGDKILDVPLAKVGGKGLFVKEIEQALIDETADIAVHSMKDVPAEARARGSPSPRCRARGPVGCAVRAGTGHRADAAEGRQGRDVEHAPAVPAPRDPPDLQIAMLRGNVPTRIKKLDDGEFDAIILAAAGLTRPRHGRPDHAAAAARDQHPGVRQGVLASRPVVTTS